MYVIRRYISSIAKGMYHTTYDPFSVGNFFFKIVEYCPTFTSKQGMLSPLLMKGDSMSFLALRDQPRISQKEAAEMMGVSTCTINKLLKDGTLKGYLIGQRYKFSRAQIEEYLNTVRISNPNPILAHHEAIEAKLKYIYF